MLPGAGPQRASDGHEEEEHGVEEDGDGEDVAATHERGVGASLAEPAQQGRHDPVGGTALHEALSNVPLSSKVACIDALLWLRSDHLMQNVLAEFEYLAKELSGTYPGALVLFDEIRVMQENVDE